MSFVFNDRTVPMVNNAFKQLLQYVDDDSDEWQPISYDLSDPLYSQLTEADLENCHLFILPGLSSFLTRGRSTVRVSVPEVIEFILNTETESRRQWDPYFTEGWVYQPLEYSQYADIVHLRWDSPVSFLMPNIDAVLMRAVKQNTRDQSALLLEMSVDHDDAVPHTTKQIRPIITCSGWFLKELSEHETEITYIHQFVPKLYVPDLVLSQLQRLAALRPHLLQLSIERSLAADQSLAGAVIEDSDDA